MGRQNSITEFLKPGAPTLFPTFSKKIGQQLPMSAEEVKTKKRLAAVKLLRKFINGKIRDTFKEMKINS